MAEIIAELVEQAVAALSPAPDAAAAADRPCAASQRGRRSAALCARGRAAWRAVPRLTCDGRLRRLRELRARWRRAPLPDLVRLVAAELVSEVCSVYAARPGDILELAATEGLNPQAIGRTRLRVGEGIVGLCAATAHGDEPAGRAEPSGLRLSSGDRRGAVRLHARRAGAPRRAHAGRAWRCRTARRATTPTTRWTSWRPWRCCWPRCWRPAARPTAPRRASARTVPRVFAGTTLVAGIAIGPVVLHGSRRPAVRVCWPTTRTRSWRGCTRRRTGCSRGSTS